MFHVIDITQRLNTQIIIDDVYTPIDIEPSIEQINMEKITKCKYIEDNPHIFIYGTNKGNIRLCDLRINTDMMKFQTKFYDEKANVNNVIAIHFYLFMIFQLI